MAAKCYHCRGHAEITVPVPIIVLRLKNERWQWEPISYVRLPCICAVPFWTHFAPYIS